MKEDDGRNMLQFKEEVDSLVSLYIEDDFRTVDIRYWIDEEGDPFAEITMEDFAGRKFKIPVIWGEQAVGYSGKPIMGACIDIGDCGTLEFSAYEVWRYLFHEEAAKRQP